MRAVIQRVSRASVEIEGRVVGEIGPGLLVLLGVAASDASNDADYLAEKVAGLRIFEDENGKMNLSVADVGGAVLAVSQFTLYGDVRRASGRPSMMPHVPSAPASFTNISLRKFASGACAARLGSFRP